MTAPLSPDLARLAHLVGIAPFYWNIAGERRELTAATARALLSAMGYAAGTDAAAREAANRLERARWDRLAPPVVVLREDDPILIPLNLAETEMGQSLHWTIRVEDGGEFRGQARLEDLAVLERHTGGGKPIERRALPIAAPIDAGYHDVMLEGPRAATVRLIVAPRHCHLPGEIAEGQRIWGLSVQLYAARSAANWGIGDFSDLCALGRWAAEKGASAIVLNPFHALYPEHPENASPYFASSRLFLNPLYLDVTRIPEFAASADAQSVVRSSGFEAALTAARDANLVDYTRVAKLKRDVLKALFAAPDRRDAFAAFRLERGAALRRFALFEALSEEFGTPVWRDWPEGLRRPDSPEAASYAESHERSILFHEYLQWLADDQLAAASSTGLAVGLCRDLAVGGSVDGADGWAMQDIVVAGARLGAPPDPLGPLGQEWGVSPLHPHALKEAAYEPFVALLRANMRHAGALRIDHVMGLARQFWVPTGESPAMGAYVSYPFEDLLGILALESKRNGAMILGEDLGTVPEGFRERMAENRVLSCRVLFFEKEGTKFRPPGSYPYLSAATAATHDLPTLKGFWQGADLAERLHLGLYPSEAVRHEIEKTRHADRPALVSAVAATGLIADGEHTAWSSALWEAIQGYLARSTSALLLVQLDDLLDEETQVNVPGTTDERPNWRRKLRLGVEELMKDPAVAERLAAIASARATPPRRD